MIKIYLARVFRAIWIRLQAVQSGRFGSRSIGFSFRVERDQFRAESNLIEKGKAGNGDKKGGTGPGENKKSPGLQLLHNYSDRTSTLSLSPFNPGHDRFQSPRISHFRLDDFPCDNHGGACKPGSPIIDGESNRDQFHIDRLPLPPSVFASLSSYGPYRSADVLTVEARFESGETPPLSPSGLSLGS